MPNWCSNDATFVGNKEQIDLIQAGIEEQKLFEKILPFPDGEWNYEWCVMYWGTKWEATIVDWERISDTEIHVSFDTAWAPPLALYEFMYECGYNIFATYYEPGMCYTGFWIDGEDDCYEYSHCETADEIAEYIPFELDEAYNISEDRRAWDEENETEVD